jgi:predicted enzyme related to lactoylglutathione lyase
MGRVVHFEITADDVARACKFYEVFGWKIDSSGMPGMDYWLAKTGEKNPGIDGAIMPRAYSPQPVINTIEVDDLDTMIEKVKAAGGQLAGDKQAIPGVGNFIYCLDTEGNKFGMLQPEDNSAAM